MLLPWADEECCIYMQSACALHCLFSLMRRQIGLRPVPFALPHSSKRQQMAGSMHRLLTWLRVRLMRKSLNVSFVQFWLTHQIGGLVNALPLESKNRRNKYRFFFSPNIFCSCPKWLISKHTGLPPLARSSWFCFVDSGPVM